ncbi:MAG: complexin-2 [Lachnospirales bacterium]
MKKVQISWDLFMLLIRYFLLESYDTFDEIKVLVEEKLDAMERRELYTKYKTSDSEEEKENARNKYLDKKGYHRDFRW